ncbi:hypothetical protein DFH06DRAFT_1358558 [Mycena polygramma]|nr:hypothetical protein DFH06DRAFT_1358558 [Mycena polygramma]
MHLLWSSKLVYILPTQLCGHVLPSPTQLCGCIHCTDAALRVLSLVPTQLCGHHSPSLLTLLFPAPPRRRWDRQWLLLLRTHTLSLAGILSPASAWSNSASITHHWPRKWVHLSASVLCKLAPAAPNRLRFRGSLLLHNIVPLLAFWPFGASPALAIPAPDPPARHALVYRLLGPVLPRTWPQCAPVSAQLCAPSRAAVESQSALIWDIFPAALPPRAGPRISANPCVCACSLSCVARCIDRFALGSAFGCWYTAFVLWLSTIARGAGLAAGPIYPAAVSRRLPAAAWWCARYVCGVSMCNATFCTPGRLCTSISALGNFALRPALPTSVDVERRINLPILYFS